MKRNFKLLVAAVVLVAMVLTLASCDVINGIIDKINPPAPHEHTFSSDWSKDETNHWHAATCTDGEECTSAKSDVAEHTFAEGKCSVCNAVDPDYTPACTEHAYSAPVVTKEPTCTESGEQTRTCTACGETLKQEVSPNGHTEEKVPGTAPTCTDKGLSDGKKCSVCETVLTEQFELNAVGHKYVEDTCSVCSYVDPTYNGPKTYVFDCTTDLTDFTNDSTELTEGATFGNGYFTISGIVKVRVGKSSGLAYAVDVDKDEKGAIVFTVKGTAEVTLIASSTDSNNESLVGILDADGNIVANKEGVTSVKGSTDAKVALTYSLPAGTYKVVSPVTDDATYNRAVRIHGITVVDTPIEKETIDATTTDTYVWDDKVSFTATEEGEYTFYLPTGLGAWGAAEIESNKAPFVDPYDVRNYDSEGEHKFTVGLEAGETYEFYISAETKQDWKIEWSFYACDVEDEVPPVETPEIIYPLQLGNNAIEAADKAFEFTAPSAANLTLTAGGAIMGNVSISYTVNGGEATTLELNASVTLALAAGDKVVITVTAEGYSTLTAAWDGEVEDDDDDDDDDQTTGPLDTENSTLVIGSNTVNVTDADLEAEVIEHTIVVTAEGTFTFGSQSLFVQVVTNFGAQIGSVYLTPGTYTVNVVTAYLTEAGEYTLTVEYTAPASSDDNGSGTEEDPFVWDELPESVTINSDTVNMIYYLYTATQNGSITITWPTADSWANWFEMDGGYTTENSDVSNEKTTMVIPVEAGKTYRIGLGTYYDAGEFTLTIAFGEGAEENTDATYVGTDDYGNSTLTVVISDTTVTFNFNHPMTGPSSATYTYAIVDGAMVLYDEEGAVLNPLAGLINIDENGVPVSAAYNGTDYTLAPAGADDDDNTDDDDDDDDETEEVEIKGALYAGEENTLAVTADDITAGKFYVSFYPWNDGEWDFLSTNLFVNSITTEAGVEIEMNDNWYYELESMTTYIIEISTEYIGNAGDYTITPKYNYPEGHQNNPFWYTLDETTTANCAGGYTPVWYQFYANATGTLTLSTELDNITLMIAGYPGYEVTNMGMDENYNTVYAKTLSLDVVQGRKYYIAVAAYESETAIDIAFTASIAEGEVTSDGTINVPHNVVIGSNTASIEAWNNVWFMYKADANGTLILSTESDNYAWYAVTDLSEGGYGSTGEISVHLYTGDILYIYVETADWSAGEVPFTASFKADPTEAWFEGNLVVDGSAANELVIEENTYAGFQVSGVVGQLTITWDNTDAIVKVNDEAIENGAVISVANPYWGPYFQVSLPEYAAGTVNLTITPYEAPSQEAVLGDNTVSANGNEATPVKFTATAAETYVITVGENAVVEYDYMSYFAGEIIKVTLGAGESVKFNVYTYDYSEDDVVISIAVAAPSVAGEYRYVDSESWMHRWVLVLNEDGTGSFAEQNYNSDTWTWSNASSHTLSYTFVKGEGNYSITIDFADGCSAVDGTYVTGNVDDTTGITSVVIGESTVDFFLYE